MARMMTSLTPAVAALVMLLMACSLGSESPTESAPTLTPVTDRPTSTPVSFLPEPTEAPTEDPGQCEPPAEEIALGQQTSSRIPTSEDPPQDRLYYCVMIPEQTSRVIFELTGTTAPLNLYVGYPDLETVQSGGVLFWSDMEGGEGDKRVVAEMGVRDFLHAGPYYVEVSPDNFEDSSPFTLVVTAE